MDHLCLACHCSTCRTGINVSTNSVKTYFSEANPVSKQASHRRHLPSAMLTPQGAPTLPRSQSSSEGFRIGLHSGRRSGCIISFAVAAMMQSKQRYRVSAQCLQSKCLQMVLRLGFAACLEWHFQPDLPFLLTAMPMDLRLASSTPS